MRYPSQGTFLVGCGKAAVRAVVSVPTKVMYSAREKCQVFLQQTSHTWPLSEIVMTVSYCLFPFCKKSFEGYLRRLQTIDRHMFMHANAIR